MSKLNKMRRKLNALDVCAKIRDRERNQILAEFVEVREVYNELVEQESKVLKAISKAENAGLNSEELDSISGLVMCEFRYDYLERLYQSHQQIEKDLRQKRKEKEMAERKYRIADAKSTVLKNHHEKEEVKFRSQVLEIEERCH